MYKFVVENKGLMLVKCFFLGMCDIEMVFYIDDSLFV